MFRCQMSKVVLKDMTPFFSLYIYFFHNCTFLVPLLFFTQPLLSFWVWLSSASWPCNYNEKIINEIIFSSIFSLWPPFCSYTYTTAISSWLDTRYNNWNVGKIYTLIHYQLSISEPIRKHKYLNDYSRFYSKFY